MPRRPGTTPTLAALLWAILSIALVGRSRAAEPVVRPALDGIFAAFETHPLVGLGDLHEVANEEAFYATVVRDPRFAATVGNVVVEFGASQHQGILDRYLAGEDVPYGELSKVWRNTVAWNPTVMGIGYQTFFAQVRAVNLSLPPDRRIRVWLSEPPIDWSTIHTKEAWQRIYDQREHHAADVILREILDRGKKALVIYGIGHFLSFPWPSTIPVPSAGTATLGEIVERTRPGAFYVVTPYGGYEKPGCSAALEAEMKWPKEVLIAPVRGTPLEGALMRPECMSQTMRGVDPLPPADELARLQRRFYEIDTGVAGDALLYLAPAAELMRTPVDPTMWMDLDYYEELGRRTEVRSGQPPPPFADLLPLVAAPPQPLWTR
jgi:hypothetical protein